MLNQITQIRLPNGTAVALTDWSDKPLFASADLGDGFVDEQIDLFQVSAGRPVPSAADPAGGAITARTNSVRDTNISTQAGLASTEEVLVYAIKPDVKMFNFEPNNFRSRTPSSIFQPGPTYTALQWLDAYLLLELEISQKIYSQAGFGWFNTGFGATSWGAGSSGGAAPATAGAPSQEAVRSLVIPSHIGAQEEFKLRLRNPTSTPVFFGNDEDNAQRNETRMITMTVYLDGLYKRPVS